MKYHLVALFTIVVWGTTFVSTKVLLESFSPLWILLLRFVLGFALLCALRQHILKLKSCKHELLFAAAGFTGIAAYYLLENIALVFTTATTVGVIVAASPLFTAVLSALRGDRSSMTISFFVGFALAMGGLVLVGFGTTAAEPMPDFTSGTLFGALLSLLAALVWAIYSLIVNKIAEEGYETIAATKRIFLWGLVAIVPVTLLFGGTTPTIGVIVQPENLLNLLFLGAIASAACFVTWGISVKHLGPAISTTYIYLVPAITATMSIILLSEPLNPSIAIGVCLTIAGLLLSQKRRKA